MTIFVPTFSVNVGTCPKFAVRYRIVSGFSDLTGSTPYFFGVTDIVNTLPFDLIYEGKWHTKILDISSLSDVKRIDFPDNAVPFPTDGAGFDGYKFDIAYMGFGN